MSVTIRRFRSGGWEVDIRVVLPDGTKKRLRRRAPVSGKSAALHWALARERELVRHGEAPAKKDVPTLAEFAPRFLDGYARANRQKPSAIAAEETILRIHLVPALGGKRLDAITNEDIQHLKAKLGTKAVKTTNNVLSVLKTVLRIAVDWDVLPHPPCTVRLLHAPHPSEALFHDFDEYDRLVAAAARIDRRTLVLVLLGGEAGLRCGEMMALEWTDLDLSRRKFWVRRSDWKGKVTVPKGGRPRLVPMTTRLAEALKQSRHLRGPRVLAQDDGSPLTQKMVRVSVANAARLAGLANAGVHVLRHTFCSHLAMRGAPARAIQELAGHQDLMTTQRYMHLSPRAVESAIRLLEEPPPGEGRGDIVETGNPSDVKSKGLKQ